MKKRYRTKQKIIVIWFSLALAFAFSGKDLHAQEKRQSPNIGFGIEIGHWLPSKFSDDAVLSSSEISGQHPYIGLVILKQWRNFALRVSGGYWEYHGDKYQNILQVSSVATDLKYSMLADIWLSPYVIYGIGWFLGNEHAQNDPHFSYLENPQLGMGFNVGAGFDFWILNFNIAVEFKYHYVTFNHVIGPTDNYSGPKISVQGIYFF